MSWFVYERFVEEVEQHLSLKGSMQHSLSRTELILAARRLGYRMTPSI